jgi:Ferritin-like
MVNNRAELIYLLSQAAELEHALCCQYLFAAFSLKRDVSEGLTWEQMSRVNDWGQTLYMIARQEMEHLGLVSNLLTAIGSSPNLERPNFPQGPKYFPIRSSLERFSEDAVKRFICFERPDQIGPVDDPCVPLAEIVPVPVPAGLSPYPVPVTSIGELYALIKWGFENLPQDDNNFFIGPVRAQVGGGVFGLNFARVGATGGVYDVTLFPVTDRHSALNAINLIIQQGEGLADKDDEFTHYQRFRLMLADLQKLKQADPAFDPARDVVSNPHLYRHEDSSGGHRISNPNTREVMDVFNAVYETLLLILLRFYAHTNETAEELLALIYTMFPLMTMVIRPLSEVLTGMPAGSDHGQRLAGPSFEISGPIQLLPHKHSAWVYLDERLHEITQRCYQLGSQPGMPARLNYIGQSIDLIASKFMALLEAPPAKAS